MTKSDAREIAFSYVKAMEREVGCELTLLDESTLEQSFGWVFFYNSTRHIETGDFRYALMGNAPIVVTRADGRIHETGTAYPLEHYLKEFRLQPRMTMWQSLKRALGFPTQAEKIAREAFRRLHPDQRIAWSRLAADEPDRFVVGVFYGDTKPPSYSFYAVSKTTAEVTPIDDGSAYRPKVWL